MDVVVTQKKAADAIKALRDKANSLSDDTWKRLEEDMQILKITAMPTEIRPYGERKDND
jgi:hypothetical protein